MLADEYRKLSTEESKVLLEESKRQKNLAQQQFIDKFISIEDFEILYRGKFHIVRRTIISLRKELMESEENRQFYIDVLNAKDFANRTYNSKQNKQNYLQLLKSVRLMLSNYCSKLHFSSSKSTRAMICQ